MSKRKKNRSGKAAVEARKRGLQGNSIKYRCLECGIEEDVPRSAIELIDILDEGIGMPTFMCKACYKGIMEAIEEPWTGEVINIVSEGSSIKEDDDDVWF